MGGLGTLDTAGLQFSILTCLLGIRLETVSVPICSKLNMTVKSKSSKGGLL